jgi:GAF domain
MSSTIDSTNFHLRATYGMDRVLIDALTHADMGVNEPNIALILAGRELIQVADLKEEAASDLNEITLRAGYRARLVAPLIRGEDVVGLLVVRRKTPGAFPPNTIDLIKTFAAQSAVAIENARLFHNVETSLQDLRTAQDRLVQTEKLASLGQLTAGIAHEIKNPRCGWSITHLNPLRHQHAGNERPRPLTQGQGTTTRCPSHHDHRLWRRGDEAEGFGERCRGAADQTNRLWDAPQRDRYAY